MKKSIFTTQTVGITLVAVILGVAVWFTVVAPQLRILKSTVDKRNTAATDLAVAQRKAKLLPAAKKDADAINNDLTRTAIAIPTASNTGEFVAALEKVAADSSVSLTSITSTLRPKVGSKKKEKTLDDELGSKYNTTVFSVRLTGGYESILAFVDHLRTLDRFNVITGTTLTNDPKTGTITASLTVNIYHKEAAKANENSK